MNDLVNRLRGIYTIPVNDGAGPLDGKDTFTRTFDNLPPIMGEAANRIEALEALLRQLRGKGTLGSAVWDTASIDAAIDALLGPPPSESKENG